MVYPAHGAGSLCGKNMRAERSSTIGTERLTNYALQIKSREEFVAQLTEQSAGAAGVFRQRRGDQSDRRNGACRTCLRCERSHRLNCRRCCARASLRWTCVRARSSPPGTCRARSTLRLSGQFASWAGTVLGLDGTSGIDCRDANRRLEEARLRLARVGIEVLDGYLAGGVAAWKQAGYEVGTIAQITAEELSCRIQSDEVQVLDVRREPEWDAAHIESASWWPLDNFRVSAPEIDRDAPVAVHCKGGYRSMIASSLLQRAGFKNVINVAGGFDAWQAGKAAYR